VPTAKDPNKMRPAKLDTFRFTTGSKVAADAIAELYGGVVKPWNGEFEVITGVNAIGVTVPPRDQVVSQWYELWNAGGCVRRCDSVTEQISGKPCLCPHADDPTNPDEVTAKALERAQLAKTNPPRACKAVTRINLMLPDLPGLGVFRLDTHSYYAAVEIGDAAALMQAARDQGVFLPATLRIDHRERVADGKTKKYPVPVLEVTATFRQVVTGQLEAGGIAAQLPPAPGEQRRALTAGPVPQTQPAAPQPVPDEPPPPNAQQIADKAKKALSRRDIESLARAAQEHRLSDDMVNTRDNTYEELRGFLEDCWRALPPTNGRPDGGAQ
jgi:hypothetical protein